jgi:LysM repeat protein
MFRRLSAVTRNTRKQRVSASAAAPVAEMEMDDGGSKISRALTIIFLIHIVAIGLIFIHQRFLDGRPQETAKPTKNATEAMLAQQPSTVQRTDMPKLSSGDKIYVVKAGDNYTRIALAAGVDEGDLRLLNEHKEIGPGLLLKVPPKRRIVAEDPPEVAAIRQQNQSLVDPGLVEAVDVSNAPKAQLIRSNVIHDLREPASPSATSPAAVHGKPYIVQPGDSIWRIANRFKISQDTLMRANSITDARKMKTGMKLVIPQSR